MPKNSGTFANTRARAGDEGANVTHFGQSQPLIKSQSFDGQTRISKSTFQGQQNCHVITRRCHIIAPFQSTTSIKEVIEINQRVCPFILVVDNNYPRVFYKSTLVR